MHPTDQVDVAKRDVGNVYVCRDINWQNCETLSFSAGSCENLAPQNEYSLSAIGPDPGWECTFIA